MACECNEHVVLAVNVTAMSYHCVRVMCQGKEAWLSKAQVEAIADWHDPTIRYGVNNIRLPVKMAREKGLIGETH